MKVLKYVFSVFCRILAVIYSIIFIPILFIAGCLASVATMLFGMFEWIFTGDAVIYNACIDWLLESFWDGVIGIARKLSDQ